MEYSPIKMQKKLTENKFNFKKNFGQNFIIDENIINSIIKKSEVDKNTLVIEIGPGAGSLTYKLCESAKNVLCYEIDTTLQEILTENLKVAAYCRVSTDSEDQLNSYQAQKAYYNEKNRCIRNRYNGCWYYSGFSSEWLRSSNQS